MNRGIVPFEVHPDIMTVSDGGVADFTLSIHKPGLFQQTMFREERPKVQIPGRPNQGIIVPVLMFDCDLEMPVVNRHFTFIPVNAATTWEDSKEVKCLGVWMVPNQQAMALYERFLK